MHKMSTYNKTGYTEQKIEIKSQGKIKKAIDTINDETARTNKILAEFENVVFVPSPAIAGKEGCITNEGHGCSVTTVCEELDIIQYRINEYNQRLSDILVVLRNQLGDSLKLDWEVQVNGKI